MKIQLNEASTHLHLHPCELVLLLAGMVGRFEDIFPTVDEGFVDTLRQMYPERFLKQSWEPVDSEQPSTTTIKLSTDAIRLIAVMRRKGYWATHTVGRKTLKNHYCSDIQDFDSAIKELLRADILSAGQQVRGPFSLNIKTKALIDSVIQNHVG